jgi:hypothetical protein
MSMTIPEAIFCFSHELDKAFAMGERLFSIDVGRGDDQTVLVYALNSGGKVIAHVSFYAEEKIFLDHLEDAFKAVSACCEEAHRYLG